MLTTSPVIAALFSAALYTATYLSLLYLLRYPRNWMPPSPFASVATGGMAVVTIVFVSASLDGMDFGLLFFLTAFIPAMFSSVIVSVGMFSLTLSIM